MVRTIRTSACLIVVTMSAVVAWIWVQSPHDSPRPIGQLADTYNTGVGMVDLYLMHDDRGFDRLLAVDPAMTGIGGRAARTVAVDRRYDIDRRVLAARLLAEHEVLDQSFIDDLATVAFEQGQETAFCAIQPGLDERLGCVG